MLFDTLYYVALVVDEDIYRDGELILEEGVDLLDGPFMSEEPAAEMATMAIMRHPREWLNCRAALDSMEFAAARIEVITITRDQVTTYNERHSDLPKLVWPPRVIESPRTITPKMQAKIEKEDAIWEKKKSRHYAAARAAVNAGK